MKVSLFYEVLHMSVTASIAIVIALCCRRLLKKAPKIFSYALWGVVWFRLLCPVSIQLPVPFVPDLMTENVDLEPKIVEHNKKMMETKEQGNLEKSSSVHSVDEGTEGVAESRSKDSSAQKTTIYTALLSVLPDVWLVGIGIMFIYSVISLICLKKKLVGSVPYNAKEKIYLSDYIETPFVIGWIKPKIYLPSNLNDKEMKYVLLHEKHHIYRKDYWFKMLAYVALILHWFNPFVWIAFVLSGKDMEMSCDEAVMKKMGGEIGQEYSRLLLRLATGKTKISPMPLAFGEGDTKERIVNVLKWKKTTKWGTFFATVLCMVVVVGCAVNWEEKEVAKVGTFKKNEITVEPKETEEPGGGLQKAIDEFGINMVFPESATCKDPKLVQVNDKFLEISYWDGISDANCTLTIRKDGKKVKTDYEFDDSLTIMWGMMGEIEVKSTVDHKVVCASWEENGYEFSICAINAGEEENEIDPSTIGKEASYIIEAFQ